MGKAISLIMDQELWETARIIAKSERRSLSAQINLWIEQAAAEVQAARLAAKSATEEVQS